MQDIKLYTWYVLKNGERVIFSMSEGDDVLVGIQVGEHTYETVRYGNTPTDKIHPMSDIAGEAAPPEVKHLRATVTLEMDVAMWAWCYPHLAWVMRHNTQVQLKDFATVTRVTVHPKDV